MKTIKCICSNVISIPDISYGWRYCICGIKVHYGLNGDR